MPDLTITTDKELMVAHVQAGTEAGVDFVDAYVLPRMAVLDSGRFIIPLDDLDDMLVAAVDLSASIVDVTARRSAS